MTTTTIRLPDDLKARVVAIAKRSGTSAHGFILEAIAEKTRLAELQAEFDTVAEQRYANIVTSGKTIPWAEMRQCLKAHAAGNPDPLPVARKLVR